MPSWYTFDVAAEQAEAGLRKLLADIEGREQRGSLNMKDFLAIASTVDHIQPFLCRRMALGYEGAVLLKESMSVEDWPDASAHLDKCDDCGYHRFTRGID